MHAARHPAHDSRALVLREILSGLDSQVPSIRRSNSSSISSKGCGSTCDLVRISSTSFAASSRIGRTKSAPLAIALRGIDGYSASMGSWTRISPPFSLTARTPTAPSDPPPLRTTAKPSLCCSAMDLKTSRSVRAARVALKVCGGDILAGNEQLPVGWDDIDGVGFSNMRSLTWKRAARCGPQ